MNPTQAPESTSLQARLLGLWERTNDTALQRLAEGLPPFEGAPMETAQQREDWIDTCLMDVWKRTSDREAFALLYERNRASFLQAIQAPLRRSRSCVDANDVLQEAFLNICQYPHLFHADRASAFRCWGHRIAHNTTLRSLKRQTRLPISLVIDEEAEPPPDLHAVPPDRAAADHEVAAMVDRAYVLFLGLYLREYGRLRPRDRRLLHLVEVDGASYREVADQTGMATPNVKVAVFRARQHLYRGIGELLATMAGIAEAPAGRKRRIGA
jgi:RNA polymerase sigma factor (sigma-70 family)